MKELWSNNAHKIKDELEFIIKNTISIVFVCQDAKAVKISAKGLAKVEGEDHLVLNYPGPFPDMSIQCICYYHFKESLMRGFQCQPFRKTEAYLVVKFPNEIFEIQRRTHPRLAVPQNSHATFLLKNKQRVLTGTVKDICLEGAKIVGNFPSVILKNDIVTPVSLNLFQKFKSQEKTVIHIPEATVARSVGGDDTTKELAIHFKLPKENRNPLEEYLEIRKLEDKI